MKKVFLLVIVLMLTLGTSSVFAESEPNNDPSAANQMSEGDNYGKLHNDTDRDWWVYTTTPGISRKVSIVAPPGHTYRLVLYKVTMPGDLEQVATLSSNNIYGYVTLYGYTSGTYYLKVEAVDGASPFRDYVLKNEIL